MATQLFRNIRSNKRKMQLLDLNSIVRKQIEDAMDKQVKPALVKSHERVVAKWEHKPEFKAQKRITDKKILVTVFPTGKNAKIYQWVDGGTEDHMVPGSGDRIYAKKAKALKFQYGGKYQPKTLAKPARTASKGGYVSGGTTTIVASVKAHMVSGIEAREFSRTIAEDISPRFKELIENAFRKAERQTEE